MPYFTRIFVKPMNLPETEAILKSVIRKSPNVQQLLDFSLAYATNTRKLAITYEAVTTYGVVVGATLNTMNGVTI